MENQFTCNLQEKLDKYDDHPSIKIINENVMTGHKFSFSDITIQDFDDEIIKLDAKKAVLDDDIPTKVLITTHDIVSNYLSMYYNDAKNNHNSDNHYLTKGSNPHFFKKRYFCIKMDWRMLELF